MELQCRVIVQRSLARAICSPVENIPLQAERDSGEEQKLFAFSPERCSLSDRNTVRNHDGIVFGFRPESRSPSTGFPSLRPIGKACEEAHSCSHLCPTVRFYARAPRNQKNLSAVAHGVPVCRAVRAKMRRMHKDASRFSHIGPSCASPCLEEMAMNLCRQSYLF